MNLAPKQPLNLFKLCIVIVSLSIMSACQSPSTVVKHETHHYNLTQKCPTLLDMKLGETLSLTVPENPTTGYQWKLAQPLKLLSHQESYQQFEAEEGMVGVGGEKTFQFKAEKLGEELIELIHIRSWESSKQPEQQWQCRVRIA